MYCDWSDATGATLAASRAARMGCRNNNRSGDQRKQGEKRALSKEDGYIDIPRKQFRKLEGNHAMVNGNLRTCGQDALVNGAKALGMKQVTKKAVYEATLPAEGDTAVGTIVKYAQDELGIEILDIKNPATPVSTIFQAKGGPAHALLQYTEGVFLTELLVSMKGKPDDRHAVVYNANYRHVDYPDIRGAIIDNEKDTPVKFIEPTDRLMVTTENGRQVPAARNVFNSLFQHEAVTRVMVVGAWLMRDI